MSVSTFAAGSVSNPIRRALRSDFVRHSALVFGASMAGNIFNYLFNFALSRRLGVEGFATLSSLVSFLMLLSIPTSVLTLVVVKYSAVYHAAEDPQRIRRLSQLLLRWTGTGSVAIFILGFLLRGPIASFLRIESGQAIVLCMGIIAVGIVTPSLRGILQGEQDFMRFSVSTLSEIFLKLVLGVSLVYLGLGVEGALLGWILAALCGLTYTAWAVLRKHGSRAGSTVKLGLDARRLFRTTAGVGLATAFLTVISFMDVLLVKHYFDAHQAGLYAAVNLSGKVVLFLVGFVPAVVLPKAVAKSAVRESALPLLLQAGIVTALMSAAALAIFGVFPLEVIRMLAGRDFVAASPYVLQYGIAMCLLALLTLLVNYRIGIHSFGFLYTLGIVLVGEICAIAVFHSSLWDVVHVLIVGNALGILACCYRIGHASTSLSTETYHTSVRAA